VLRKYSFRTVPDIFASSPGFELAFAMHTNLSTLSVTRTTDFLWSITAATPSEPSRDAKAAILPKFLVFSPNF
jgi:hypothetical protein